MIRNVVDKIKVFLNMRLPRRVPWSSLAELEQVCSWIYTDENDWDSTMLAINRVGHLTH
jgi:hypothetical protein